MIQTLQVLAVAGTLLALALGVWQQGQEGRTDVIAGTLGREIDEDVPVIGTSFEVGRTLGPADQQGAR